MWEATAGGGGGGGGGHGDATIQTIAALRYAMRAPRRRKIAWSNSAHEVWLRPCGLPGWRNTSTSAK